MASAAELEAPCDERDGVTAALFKVAGDGVVFLDPTGRVISTNDKDSHPEGVGCSRTQIGKLWPEQWSEEARADLELAIKAAATGQVARFSTYGSNSGTAPRHWAVSIAPVTSRGQVTKLVAAYKEISAPRHDRESGRFADLASEALELSPYMFWAADRHGAVEYVNPARLEFLGCSRAEAMGRRWLEAIHPDDRSTYVAAGEAAAKARSTFDHTFQLLSAKRGYRWVRSRAYPKLDDQGRITRWYGFCEEIHEQKLSLDALGERERRLQAIQDTLPDCVNVVAVDGTLIDMNPAGLAMIGAECLDEVRGRDVSSLVVGRDRDAFVAYREAAAAGTLQEPLRFQIEGLGGAHRWLETRSAPLRDAEGRTWAVLSVTSDISERRSVEQSLRESEEHHRFTVELAPQIPFVMDPAANMLEISSRWTEITGQPREAAVGRGWLTITHPDDMERVQSAASHSLSTGEPYDERSRKLTGDGSYRWLRVRAYPRRSGDGSIRSWYGYAEDVDQAVHAEEALRRSEERLRLVTAAAGIGVYDAGADGIATCSPIYCDIYGLPRDASQLGYEEWLGLIHADDRERVDAASRAAAQSGGRVDYEFRIVRRDTGETRWIDSRGKVRTDDAGRMTRSYGAQWDITERKAAEAELKRLQAQAMRSARLNAMGAMASTLAHELNQPLAASANYLAAASIGIERGTLDQPKVLQTLKLASNEAVRAGNIVRKLRSFVTRGEVTMQLLELRQLVSEAVNTASTSGLRLAPQIVISGDLPRVLGDATQIEQVLTNLLRNASEATAGTKEPSITITGRREGQRHVRVTVEDNGPGVSSDTAKLLFSPFASSKEDGMGVGLSISRTIIEAHGGQIWHEQRDRGAAFVFTLRCDDGQL